MPRTAPLRTSVTHMRESVDGLARWLTDVFDGNHWQPDTLFLVGSRGDLELISETLEEALPMPVVASDDAQLVLARGAALAVSADTDVAAVQADSAPVADKRAHRPFRFRSHAVAATVLVAGAVALFTLGPEFAAQQESGSSDNQPSANSSASVTSATSVSSATPASVRAVPPPRRCQLPQRRCSTLAAEPPPVTAQPEALPRSDAARPPDPAPAVATPVVAPVAASQEQLAVPVVAPPAPLAPPPALTPPAPLAPPPAAPAAPFAPPPPPAPTASAAGGTATASAGSSGPRRAEPAFRRLAVARLSALSAYQFQTAGSFGG